MAEGFTVLEVIEGELPIVQSSLIVLNREGNVQQTH